MVYFTFQVTSGTGNNLPPLSVPVYPISFLLTTWHTSTCRTNLCGSFHFVPPCPLLLTTLHDATTRTRTIGKQSQPEKNRIIPTYKAHCSCHEHCYTVLLTIGRHVTRHGCHEVKADLWSYIYPRSHAYFFWTWPNFSPRS